MDMDQVKALFTLFSGEEDTTTYQPVIYVAMTEVRQMLREGASETDARLGYLAAAIANLRYTEIFGAREKALATYAGTIARQSEAASFCQAACLFLPGALQVAGRGDGVSVSGDSGVLLCKR